MKDITVILLIVHALLLPPCFAQDDVEVKPNVLILMTDEHNIRTIGRYRDLMETDEAFVWGDNVKVSTPHINNLGMNGATFTNFYTVSPLCTPARGSFLTGTYPSANGATANHVPMNEDAVTFAQIFQDKLGYNTAYMGKWHLDGEVKGPKQFGSPEGRSFGFNHTEYRWNRGHHKFLKPHPKNGKLRGYTYEQGTQKINDKQLNKFYTSDYLARKASNFIADQATSEKPFMLMVSFPDPHPPNIVRPPYDTMFDHLTFSLPETAKAAFHKKPALPRWSWLDPKFQGIPLSEMDQTIEDIETSERYQKQKRSIFGMIKLIDDKVGEIMTTLEESGLKNNTIVVFTSDHGAMMTEHGKENKILPYKASAVAPFIIQWPNTIPSGKVVKKTFSTIDFMPTLLKLVGINDDTSLPGLDASADLKSDSLTVSGGQTRFIDGPGKRYAAAVNGRYKLVLTKKGTPWLFDMKKDAGELYNVYNKNENYQQISAELQEDLLNQMKWKDFGLMNQNNPIYLGQPDCFEKRDQLEGSWQYMTCLDFEGDEFNNQCKDEVLQTTCPVSCDSCDKDTEEQFLFKKKMFTCKNEVKADPHRYCENEYISLFCPKTCSKIKKD